MKAKFLINRKSIEEELLNSDILIKQKIEPYCSLNCFVKSDYNIGNCLICSRFEKKCREIFINGGYIEEKYEV